MYYPQILFRKQTIGKITHLNYTLYAYTLQYEVELFGNSSVHLLSISYLTFLHHPIITSSMVNKREIPHADKSPQMFRFQHLWGLKCQTLNWFNKNVTVITAHFCPIVLSLRICTFFRSYQAYKKAPQMRSRCRRYLFLPMT